MTIKQILAIIVAVIGIAIGGSYLYDYLRLKPGHDCFDYFVELEKTKDLKLVDMFDENSKVILKRIYPDKTVTIETLVGNQFREAYREWLLSEEAKNQKDEYWDITVEKKDGNFIVNSIDYRVHDNTQGPFRVVFDGNRTDRCMILESGVVIPTNKRNPLHEPEENDTPPPVKLPSPPQQ